MSSTRYKKKKLPRVLGVDDNFKILGKGKPVTVLTDLDTGDIIDIAQGTSFEDVSKMLESHDGFEGVEEFACDGAAQYIKIGRNFFPHAHRTLDRWHIIKKLQDAFAAARANAKKNNVRASTAQANGSGTSECSECNAGGSHE